MSNLSQFLGGGTNRATAFTSSGSNTFTQPNNVSWVSAILVGGGSGGWYNDPVTNNCGGGGGGGGCTAIFDKIYLTGNLTVTIGAGGNGGVYNTSTAPTGGGNTTITSNFPGSPTFTAIGCVAQRTAGTVPIQPIAGAPGVLPIETYVNPSGTTTLVFPLLTYSTQGYISDPQGGGAISTNGTIAPPYYGGGGGGRGGNGTNVLAGYSSGLGIPGGAAGTGGGAGSQGGGGGAAIGTGGTGGTGNSGPTAGSSAAANTGGGGGGAGVATGGSGLNGGNGGSGYALICYVGTN